MPECYPLMQSTTDALGGGITPRHPGLLLDIFTPYLHDNFDRFDMEKGQLPHLKSICAAMAAFGQAHQGELLSRWNDIADAADRKWELTTVWRLAAHLSRPTALENAALSLHPVYGFPYLIGSGLKGLAVAFAEEQSAPAADRQRVFGNTGRGGSVVFLEAWPEAWPKIEVDITNSHHPEYYRSLGGSAPGDWESPIPVYFLTVAPRTTFRFALRKARPETLDTDLELAQEWLTGGLTELGFGAKTAAGYGYFAPPSAAGGLAGSSTAATETSLEDFKAWAVSSAKTNDVPRAVREGLGPQLRRLCLPDQEKARNILLQCLSSYRDLWKKGKGGKPSLGEWIRNYSPQ